MPRARARTPRTSERSEPASSLAERIPDARRGGAHHLVALVLLTRPEEATEAVLAPPGHDVQVHVGDALAHHVVHGNEGTVGVHALLDGGRETLTVEEQF